MPKQMYEVRGADLESALLSLYQAALGEKAPRKGEEMRYRVDLVSQNGERRFSSGEQKTYELALDTVQKNVTDVTTGQPYESEVFVKGKYDVQRQPETPRASGAAPSKRRTCDITKLF